MADEIIGGVAITVGVDTSQMDSDFAAAVSKAQGDADKLASAIQDAVRAPDTGAVVQSFGAVGDAATQAGTAITQALDIQIPPLDTSAAVGSLEALGTAATNAGVAITAGLSDVNVPALDTSAAQSSLTALGDAATTAGSAITASFADVSVPALDTSAAIASLDALGAEATTVESAIVSGLASTAIPALDTSAAVDSVNAIGAAVTQLSDTITTGSAGVVTFDDAMAALVGEGLSVNDAFQQLTGSTQSFMDAVKSGDLNTFVENFGKLDTEAQPVAADLENVAKSAGDASTAIQQVGNESQGAAGGVNALDDGLENLKNVVPPVVQEFQEFSDAAQRIVSAQQQADAEFHQAVAVLQEITNAYQTGSADADMLARAEQNVASAFQAANPAIQQTKQAVDATKESMVAMNQVLGALGVTLGLAAFVHFAESIGEAYDSITRTNIALTTLTGSATQAAEMVEKLDKLGVADGLSMPSLQKAAIRMQEFLPEGTDIVGVLSQIADAASLTGTSIETASQKFSNIVETGKLSVKALKDLGLSFDDIKKAMEDAGVSADRMGASVKKGFEQLSQNDQLVVLQTALEKFKGTAEDIAENTFQGQWHRATAQFESDINTIIKDVGDLNGKFPDLTKAVNGIAVVFVAVGGTIKTVTDDITSNVVALGVQLQGIGKAAKDALSGNFQQAAKDISDAMEAARAVSAKAAADWKTNVATMNKTISDLENQVSTSVPVVIKHLDNLAKGGKDAADKIAAAGVAVQKFVDQIAAGGTVTQLQKDFENAGKAIDKVATADLPAAIRAVDDYTQAQIRNGANASVMIEALTKYQALIDKLAKESLQGAIVAEQKLVEELVAGKQPLDLVTAAFEKEETMIQKLAKEDYPAAITAAEKLVDTFKNSPQYLNLYNDAVDGLNKLLKDHEAKLNAAVAAQQKFVESIKNVALGIPTPQKALDDMNKTLDSIGASSAAMPAKMTPLNRALVDAGLGAEAANTSLKKIPGALDSIHTPIASVITDLDNLAKDAQNTGQWDNYEAAIDKVGKRFATMSKDDLPQAVTQFEAVIQEMIKVGAPTDMITAALDRLAPALKKMAEENLPGSKAAWQGYLDLLAKVPSAIKDIQQADEEQIAQDEQILASMKARGDAYGYILAQQEKLAAEQAAYAEKTGHESDEIVLGLEKQKLARKILADETHGYADIEVKAINDILNAFDHLGQAMGDAIVNGKNLGEALIGEFKKLGASIIGDVIQAALLPMKIELEKMIHDALPGLDLGLKKAAVSTTGLGAASQQAAVSQDTLSASAGGATASLTAMGIASTLAAIQLNTLITAIAAVVGAIAAIVGDVYLAAIDSKLFITNTTLAAIKNETQTRRADAWVQYNNTYGRLGEMWNTLQRIMDQIGSGQVGGAANPQTQADLDALVAAMQPLTNAVHDVNYSVQALNQTSTSYLQTIIGDLQDINNSLFKINTSILQKGSGGGGDSPAGSQSSQADVIVGAMKDNANAITSSMHAEFGGLIPPVGTIGRVLDAAAQQQLRDAQRDYNAAMSVAEALDALGREYNADTTLMNDALAVGNIQQAEQYQQAAAAVQRQIDDEREGMQYAQKSSQAIQDYTAQSKSAYEAAQAAVQVAQGKVDQDIATLTEDIRSGNAKAIATAQAQLDKDNEALKQAQSAAQQAAQGLAYDTAQNVSATNQTGASVSAQVAASGSAVVGAVNGAASTIAAAVDGLTLQPGQTGASSSGGTLTNTGGPKVGAGTGPGVGAAAGEQSPLVQDVKLPGGGTGAYTVPLIGAGSGAGVSSGGSGRSVGNPTVGDTTVKVVPQYQTGGMVSTDGLLAAEKGEAVLTPDQVQMLQSIQAGGDEAGTAEIGPVADLAQAVAQAKDKVHMDLDTITQELLHGNKVAAEMAEKLLQADKEALAQAQQAQAAADLADRASREGQQQLSSAFTSLGQSVQAMADGLPSGGLAPIDETPHQGLTPIDETPHGGLAPIETNSLSPGSDKYFDPTFNTQSPGADKYFDPAFNSQSPGSDKYFDPTFNTPSPGADKYHDAGNPLPPRDVFSGYNPYGADQPFLVPRYQTGGMVDANGLLAAEKGESVLTPDQTQALQSLGARTASDPNITGAGDTLISKTTTAGAHVIPQGGQPERVAYGTQGPDAASIGPAIDAAAAAAKDAAKAMQDRLDLLNQELSASKVNSGLTGVQTIELENQIADLLKEIAESSNKTAGNTGTMALNPPGAGPSTIDNSISPAATDYFGYGGVGPGPGPGAGNTKSPGADRYFDAGNPGPGPRAMGPPLIDPGWGGDSSSPGAGNYFAGMQTPSPSATRYNDGQQIGQTITPHNVFSGYNPYGANQPFALGSYDTGGRIPVTGLYQLHQDEEVIQPDLSKALRQMVGTGGGGSAGKRGDVTINAPVTINGVQDGRRAAQQFVSHLKTIIPAGAFGQ